MMIGLGDIGLLIFIILLAGIDGSSMLVFIYSDDRGVDDGIIIVYILLLTDRIVFAPFLIRCYFLI